MSFSNSRSSTNFALPNSATQTSPNLDERWILNWTHNMQAAPDITARRVTAFDFIRKGFVKVNGTGYSIAQLMRFAQEDLLSANSEQDRIVLVDADSDTESLTAMTLDRCLSYRHAQLPTTPTEEGSENDDKHRIGEKNTREVGLALDTTGFHSGDTTEAMSDAKHFDASRDTQTNDNFGVAKADDSPGVHIINTLASRKRVQSEAPKNPVVYVTSDAEDDVEVMPNTQPNSRQDTINQTDNEVEHRQKPNKRPRLTKEATATHVQLNSSKGSGKACDDGSKARRKSNIRTKLTTREFKDHIDTEATQLSAASTRCNVLRKLFKNQRERIAALDSLEAEHCQIVAKLSVDCLPRHARLQLRAELEDVEDRRGDVTVE